MSLMEVRKIRITLITDLLGSSPLNPDTYKDYIVTKKTPELEPEKAAEEIVKAGGKAEVIKLCLPNV